MKILTAQSLTKADFTPYGDLVAAHPVAAKHMINDGHTIRYHDLADIHCQDKAAKVTVNIFRSDMQALPVMIEKMERHPKSSQMFMPLSDRPYLVVVAPPGDFDPDRVEAFVAHAGQGVNYHAGTWHHYSLALEGVSDFLVMDYADVEDNCDEVALSEPLQVKLP
ncbi:ureidoglycolate lyase [Paremcibacter congregatus]|uniref:ureidoglycolate lyase n=1 Tax=Paremcibacter congregatus TaxID=2043170 RepID=UPI003A91882C|tara:strand:- start:156 stop:650 length:495 start_codon:yes stop_codon:yes gene_type:complete